MPTKNQEKNSDSKSLFWTLCLPEKKNRRSKI